MASKDQAIGGMIFIVCLAIGILYTAGLLYFGTPFQEGLTLRWPIEFTLIAIPVFIAFIAIMGIGAWIGWTMATTPPPKPIEEITSEIEEKKEETPAEPKEETKPPEEAPEEEKKSEKKKRA